ncbi:MAG TPA: hypothetical protein VLK03_01775 [Nocardioides sp.]|nr:hypothetical protein [Nocardioides sp.]
MLTLPRSLRRLLTLLVIGVLAAVLGGLGPGPATAAPPAPTEIRIDTITSAVTAPSGTPGTAIPTVLVVADQELTVTVSFYDSTGRPAAFTKDTRIAVTSGQAAVTPLQTLVRKGVTRAGVTVSIGVPVNQVRLTVAFTTGKVSDSDTALDGERFDVLSELRFEGVTPEVAFEAGIGGRDDCSQATAQDPVCGVVILPRGAGGGEVLLSLGACEPDPEPGAPPAIDYSGCGDERGVVVQTLADLEGYTSTTTPATMIIKCDKILCGGGSVQDQTLSYTLDGNADLGTAPACPAKGTLGPEPACVDYVQSKRDGAGDTYFYLLLLKDARVSVG